MNQIPHFRINQINDNTLNITKPFMDKCGRILPIIMGLIAGILCFIVWGIVNDLILLILAIIEFLVAIIFLIFFIRFQHTINFILGENDITVEEISYCRKKITNYVPGQLIKVELTCEISNCNCITKYNHRVNFKCNKSSEDKIYCDESFLFAPGYFNLEIGYFNYFINRHIQTKMMTEKKE